MGRLVVWWSVYHGQSKTTASMLATALAVAEQGKKICVTHTQPDMSDLEGMLNYRAAEEEINDVYSAAGLSAVVLDFKGSIVSEDSISRATFQPIKNCGLYMLPGITRNEIGSDSEDEDILYHVLTKEIKDSYDYLFVELSTGYRSSLTKRLMQAADIAVVCMSQNNARLAQYFDSPAEESFEFERDKIIMCFGGYRRGGRVNYKTVSMKWRIPCIVVPDNDGIFNAISDGNVCGYYLSCTNNKDKHSDGGYFISKVREGAKVITKK